MWPEVCELPLLGPGRPSLSGQAAWRQGHGLYEASKMGTWVGGGSLTPSSSLGGGRKLRPSALSCVSPPSQALPWPWLVARTSHRPE